MSLELEGCPIIDTAITPRRRGVIVSVSDDGSVVHVAWKPGQVTRLRLEPGRYVVELPPSTRLA